MRWPRRVAPWSLICLLRWAAGRHPAGTPGHFAYHRNRKVLVLTFFALLSLESVVTHLVLLVIFGSRWWVWLIFAVDVSTLVWIVGLYASMIVLPHRIDATELRLRYGYLAELVVPRPAIRAVRPAVHPERRPGRLVVDGAEGTFGCGESTIVLDLDPGTPLTFRGKPVRQRIATLRLTADDPAGFSRWLRPGAG